MKNFYFPLLIILFSYGCQNQVHKVRVDPTSQCMKAVYPIDYLYQESDHILRVKQTSNTNGPENKDGISTYEVTNVYKSKDRTFRNSSKLSLDREIPNESSKDGVTEDLYSEEYILFFEDQSTLISDGMFRIMSDLANPQ